MAVIECSDMFMSLLTRLLCNWCRCFWHSSLYWQKLRGSREVERDWSSDDRQLTGGETAVILNVLSQSRHYGCIQKCRQL